MGFIISLAEFISEKDTNHSSIEIISQETSEYSGRNSRSGWRVLGILRSYRKRFFWGSHTAWRDRAHRNGSLLIECGKHGSKFLFKETGKKSSIADKRQEIYTHLNENIFKPLLAYENLEWSLFDYPVSMLKLNYNLSKLKDNSDYNEARIHWEHDLPKSITNPERLEEKIRALNEDVDGFFNQEIIQYVRAIQWNDFFLSDEQSGIPAMNHISIPNTIREIRRDWLEGANTKRFERYDRDSRVYSLNGRAIAHIEPPLENRLSELLDVLREHYTINQSIQCFREQREHLLREHGGLRKEIGKEIVSKIERQQYTTTCQYCDDTAISPKP